MLERLRIVLLVPILASCAGGIAAKSVTPIPVEVRQAGDDGLTQRLVHALEQGIGSDGRFALRNGPEGQGVTLVVPHVEWKDRSSSTVLYPEVTAQWLQARDASAQTKKIRVTCKETEIELCARSILQRLHAAVVAND